MVGFYHSGFLKCGAKSAVKATGGKSKKTNIFILLVLSREGPSVLGQNRNGFSFKETKSGIDFLGAIPRLSHQRIISDGSHGKPGIYRQIESFQGFLGGAK